MKKRLQKFIAYLFTMISAFMSTLIAFFFMNIIDTTVYGDNNEMRSVLVTSVIFIILFVLTLYIQFTTKNRYIGGSMTTYKEFLFNKVVRKNVRSFYSTSTGNYISSMTQDINTIRDDYYEGSFLIVEQASSLVFAIISMFYLSYQLAFAVLLISILPFVASLLFGRKIIERQKKVSDINGVHTSSIKDIFTGFSTIKAFNIEMEMEKEYRNINCDVENAYVKHKNTISSIELISSVLTYLVLLTVFGVGSILANNGLITVGTIIAFIQLLNNLLGPANILALSISKRRAANELRNKAKNLMLDNTTSKPGTELLTMFDEIKADGLSFAYSGTEEPILKGINLTVSKGEKIAIVGSSGSGKSTLLSLILGLYDNYLGTLKVNNVDIKDIDMGNWYRFVSVVEQTPFIFDGNIERNITLNQIFDASELQKAIDDAGLRELIDDKGLDYYCGENGKFLSGGEKQRISIARCLLRKKKVLLLDESTASLDKKTANEIENGLLSLSDVTCIVVTHRLEAQNLKKYDSIVVMKNGSVAEIGTFDELIDNRQDFYALYNSQ